MKLQNENVTNTHTDTERTHADSKGKGREAGRGDRAPHNDIGTHKMAAKDKQQLLPRHAAVFLINPLPLCPLYTPLLLFHPPFPSLPPLSLSTTI